MKKTAIVYSKKFLNHDVGRGHPESPRRLQAIIDAIKEYGLLKQESCTLIAPEKVSDENLETVHSKRYIKYVKDLCKIGGGVIDEETETVVSRKSFEIAQLAAGGVIKAIDKVMSREFRNGFVLARPPGHHAGPDYGLGFCIFNNVAIGAQYLLNNYSLERVLILDIDSHHGNGTQQIFYDTKKVLYISLHEDPTEFPKSGFANETGQGEGHGYTVNIPLPFHTCDAVYWKAVKTIALPIINQYKPQFILVSAGFDGYYRDTVGELSLSLHIYHLLFQALLDLADNMCDGRMVAVLEGGYCLSAIKKAVPAVISLMAGKKVVLREKIAFLDLRIQKHAETALKNVRRIQSSFWNL
ncbi:MAG: histone deacetylase [Candidatus Bathyarchaeia archaeon]